MWLRTGQLYYSQSRSGYKSITCCILETHSHRRCNNNKTDVTQEVMLHMQHHFLRKRASYLRLLWLTGSFCVQTQTINSMCWRSCRVHAVGVGLHTPCAASLICTCALLARTSLTMPRIRAMPSSHAPCNRCQELIQRALLN